MTTILMILLFAAAVFWSLRALLAARSAGGRPDRGRLPCAETGSHYKRHYGRRGFLQLGGAVAAAAVLVYSGADKAVDAWHRDRIRSPRSDRVAETAKIFGERFWFGFWAAFMLLDSLIASNPLTRWGRRTFEAMVVGLPALWTTQRVLGASRPTDGDSDPAHVPDPRYHPMDDDNSASGHAFIAAIPWLTLMRRTGSAPVRAGSVAAMLPTGWSRLNDRRHFFSQIVLGYALAWQATGTVAAAEAAGRETPRGNDRPDGALRSGNSGAEGA